MNLTVLVLSCRRIPYLERTIAAARRHFCDVEPDAQVTWTCFDNGSAAKDRQRLESMGFDLLLLSKENLGQGPALNQLVATVRTEFFLLLEDDWVIESPRPVRFTSEAAAILRSDLHIGQVKLDSLHFANFTDRQTYDGPFRVGAGVPFYVQNPRMMWGGFCCPPAITRTESVRSVGPFREDQPFRKWWAESEYSARFSQHFVVAKSPEMLLFRHIGDESCRDWQGG